MIFKDYDEILDVEMGVEVYPMHLPHVDEPVKIKEDNKQLWSVMCDGKNNADCDRRVVWNNNELAKYLWEHWAIELRRNGYDWQRFLKVLKLATGDIVLWSLKDALSWDELIKRISSLLESYRVEYYGIH
jgi:hypothetical protein